MLGAALNPLRFALLMVLCVTAGAVDIERISWLCADPAPSLESKGSTGPSASMVAFLTQLRPLCRAKLSQPSVQHIWVLHAASATSS